MALSTSIPLSYAYTARLLLLLVKAIYWNDAFRILPPNEDDLDRNQDILGVNHPRGTAVVIQVDTTGMLSSAKTQSYLFPVEWPEDQQAQVEVSHRLELLTGFLSAHQNKYDAVVHAEFSESYNQRLMSLIHRVVKFNNSEFAQITSDVPDFMGIEIHPVDEVQLFPFHKGLLCDLPPSDLSHLSRSLVALENAMDNLESADTDEDPKRMDAPPGYKTVPTKAAKTWGGIS